MEDSSSSTIESKVLVSFCPSSPSTSCCSLPGQSTWSLQENTQKSKNKTPIPILKIKAPHFVNIHRNLLLSFRSGTFSLSPKWVTKHIVRCWGGGNKNHLGDVNSEGERRSASIKSYSCDCEIKTCELEYLSWAGHRLRAPSVWWTLRSAWSVAIVMVGWLVGWLDQGHRLSVTRSAHVTECPVADV